MNGLRGCHAEWSNKDDDDSNITTNIYWVLTMCWTPWEHFPRIISFHPHINHVKKALVLPSYYKEGKWLLRDRSLIKDNKWKHQELSPSILSWLLYIILTIAAIYNINNNSYITLTIAAIPAHTLCGFWIGFSPSLGLELEHQERSEKSNFRKVS